MDAVRLGAVVRDAPYLGAVAEPWRGEAWAAPATYSVAGSMAEYGTDVRTPLAESGASTPSVAVLRPYSGSNSSLTILPCTGSVSR